MNDTPYRILTGTLDISLRGKVCRGMGGKWYTDIAIVLDRDRGSPCPDSVVIAWKALPARLGVFQ
ncbi:MAG: hypothetical protein GXP40_13050 [Chloroflexi bacterium]|nr:hypothetical protein [Chloroflexota bacterium]